MKKKPARYPKLEFIVYKDNNLRPLRVQHMINRD